MPNTPTSVATAAAIPSAVNTLRRGRRSTSRSGRVAMTEPGNGRRWTSGANPPRAVVRGPVRMASIGGTRTARITGQMLAASTRPTPSAVACRYGPTWNGRSHTGIGKKDSVTVPMAAPTT